MPCHPSEPCPHSPSGSSFPTTLPHLPHCLLQHQQRFTRASCMLRCAGIASSMLNFVVVYSRQGTTTVAAAMTSKYRHSFDQRQLLREWQSHSKGVVVLSLRGFLFFGSSAKVLQVHYMHWTVWHAQPCRWWCTTQCKPCICHFGLRLTSPSLPLPSASAVHPHYAAFVTLSITYHTTARYPSRAQDTQHLLPASGSQGALWRPRQTPCSPSIPSAQPSHPALPKALRLTESI